MATPRPQNRSQQATTFVMRSSQNAQQSITLPWSKVFTWQQDNRFITSGYRPASNSYKESVASIWYIHNQTVNIWTHLIGAVGATFSAVAFYGSIQQRFEMATMEDVVMFLCFFLGAAGCLGMSATYHAISNHSAGVAALGNQLDYMGIIILIWGSFIPSVYYGFNSDPRLTKLYWTMITTAAGITFALVLYPRFRTPSWRPLRAGAFAAMGLTAVAPVTHGLWLYGLNQMYKQIGLPWLVIQGLLYLLGALIYAARVPERWSPGSFDIWGSSHQIFHVLVVLASGAHFVGLLKAFDYTHNNRE